MNIREAKEEIKASLLAYHAKDEAGMYLYPRVRQRPILLMGPPGIGKTAIMEQIARECGVGLVSYTMTHHTRQSAIGLPKIVNARYGEEDFCITEYTLSEIIASVYQCMERTGNREGILFIDEINCVSETLAPVMLQFLQNKTFGNHPVPEGWMIVAAGNPPQYNKSVREFDIVTLDRVRKIEVEAEAECWMDYAMSEGIHGAVLAYLTLKPERFYQIRQENGNFSFVTARGWEDLSCLLTSYERMNRSITPQIVEEFLQDPGEAAYFAAYYQIYRKYGKDYEIRPLLEGSLSREACAQQARLLSAASLEERFTAVLQMQEVLRTAAGEYEKEREALEEIRCLSALYAEGETLEEFVRAQQEQLRSRKRLGLVSEERERASLQAVRFLLDTDLACRQAHQRDAGACRKMLEDRIGALESAHRSAAGVLSLMVERAVAFCREAFGEQELFLLVSSLAKNRDTAVFLTEHPCEAFSLAAEAYQRSPR